MMPPEDIKPHQLVKQLPMARTRVVFEASVYDNAASTTTNGWENIAIDFDGLEVGGILNRSYIDLAGWTREELTSFWNGFDIQKSFPPIEGTGTMPIIYEYDFITTRRLTRGEVSVFLNEPGFLPSTVDLMQLIYAERRVWGKNAQIPGSFLTVDASTSGTGDPVATDKLHWTRLYIFATALTTSDIGTSPTNLVVAAVTAKEKDLVWMERLRRSYVLEGHP